MSACGKARIIHTVLVVPAEVMDNQPMLDLFPLHAWAQRWAAREMGDAGATPAGDA